MFGVALFLACPLVIRSSVLITADLPLAVLLFFAFYLWWGGNEQGSIGFARWLAIGVVLAFAGLLKGPQPIAYFALGVGLYILGSRSWRQIPGLILAGVICALPLAAWYAAIYTPGDEANWGTFMRVHPALRFSGPFEVVFRLLGETLPAALLAAAFLIARAYAKGCRARLVRPGFVAALACYAFTAALLILFWPGGSTPRYYFPMVLPLAVFGGLGYDLLSARRPQIVAPVMLLTAALLAYAWSTPPLRRSCRCATGKRRSTRHGSSPWCKPRPARSTGPATPRSTSCPTCRQKFSKRRPTNWRRSPVPPGWSCRTIRPKPCWRGGRKAEASSTS